MRKLFALTVVVVATYAVSAHGAAKPVDVAAPSSPWVDEPGLTRLLAQAQAPGRPTTPQEQQKPAPAQPNKDPIVNRPPPPPGTPNFPQRPPNDPPLRNPLNKK